ncbi:MAG TPA: RNA polymerase sigma factor [Saprospiraceae bacterium]|nr:RNA polymerase sigma factor [Saprospiraceae bacterium]HMP24261.1 RNA polymerase sigma factor [Saprospiraceae bacterium]
MNNPFSTTYHDAADSELIRHAREGSKQALEMLLTRHRHYIYNVALKMILSPFDAEDLTQEVLIKIITNLSSFREESSFRTWAYRITFNHFLKMKQHWLEEHITTFEQYGETLEQMPDTALLAAETFELQDFIEDAKIGCMSGMLLCLDREQRLVYILGELFGIDHTLGSQMLDISKDNFRQRLARARHDLYQFMNKKCGLINQANPCRCAKKTKAFIAAGWVDTRRLKFNTDYLQRIYEVAPQKSTDLCELVEVTYADLFRAHPFQEKAHLKPLIEALLSDSTMQDIFDLQ